MSEQLKRLFDQTNVRESALLSPFATPNEKAVRTINEKTIRYRPPFAIDRDRIFYSGAFRRYTGKTQVIYFVSLLDEQLTSRILHTLSVSQISKSIGRLLSLNTDLIESIALGHDLGHPPFGHDGEYFLSKISKKHGLGHFLHNIQSLRVVDRIANKGQGLNLTFQTRDGILSHNGEVHNRALEADTTKKESELLNYIEAAQDGKQYDMMPATLEGCVVRLTDTIAYIGQDIDDAIRIGLITRDQLPEKATRLLGSFNNQIIETLINDVVDSSAGNKYIAFSDYISEALLELKKFNYREIYKSPKLKINHSRIEKGLDLLFDHFLEALRSKDQTSDIFQHFLLSKSSGYLDNTSDQLKVRDYLAGMTDRYFVQVLKKIVVPELADFSIFNE